MEREAGLTGAGASPVRSGESRNPKAEGMAASSEKTEVKGSSLVEHSRLLTQVSPQLSSHWDARNVC